MTTKLNRCRALAVVCCASQALMSISAPAQTPVADSSAITLTIAPQAIAANGQVRFSGLALADPRVPVVITVTSPSATKVKVNATPDKTGRYALSFGQTGAVGNYNVSAQAGSGTPVRGDFTVQPTEIVLATVVKDLQDYETSLVNAIPAIKLSIDNVPNSPARQDTDAALDRLETQLQKMPAQAAVLTQLLKPFETLVAQRPGSAAVLQPLFDQLTQWDESEKQHKADIDKQVAATKQKLAVCDSIDSSIEGLKAVSAGLNLANKPFNIILSFAKDMRDNKESALVIDNLSNSDAKFAVSETVKMTPIILTAVEGPIGMFTIAAGLVVDCAQQLQARNFDKYCEKFEGPFTATMTAHFYAKGYTKEWWGYSTTIAGKLVLRYPKAASGQAVALTGQFEGAATNFTYNEDVWNNSDLIKIAKGGIVQQMDVAPGATPAADWEGSVANTFTSPTSFYVTVTGQLADDKITLQLGDARSDFVESYTQAHTVYIVWSYATVGLPVAGHFSLPYQNARFILNHLVKGDFPIQRKGDSMVIQRTDTQDRPMPGNDAVYTIKLQSCNPGCT